MKKPVSPVVAIIVIVIVIAIIAGAIWMFSSRSRNAADQGVPQGFTKKPPPGTPTGDAGVAPTQGPLQREGASGR